MRVVQKAAHRRVTHAYAVRIRMMARLPMPVTCSCSWLGHLTRRSTLAGSLYVASGISRGRAPLSFADFTTEITANPLETTSSRFEQIETCVCESGGTGIFVEEPNPEREPHKRPNWALEDVDTRRHRSPHPPNGKGDKKNPTGRKEQLGRGGVPVYSRGKP